MFMLDTNVIIAVSNGRSPQVAARLNAEMVRGSRIGIPAIVMFELRYGIAKSIHAAKSEAALAHFLDGGAKILAFEAADAAHAAEIRAHLERAGTPIGPYDVLIAGQARSRGATLVTGNRREFDRVPGLQVVDWSQ